jgi:hypothetical protein
MREKPTNTPIIHSVSERCSIEEQSTALQLSISQKALGTLREDGNVMSKHVGDTIYNKLNE